MQTKTYNVYTFDELSDGAKEKAIHNHILFELEIADENSYIWPAIEKAEQMQTPWFAFSYVYEMFRDAIIENIKVNNYNFTEDGRLD